MGWFLSELEMLFLHRERLQFLCSNHQQYTNMRGYGVEGKGKNCPVLYVALSEFEEMVSSVP